MTEPRVAARSTGGMPIGFGLVLMLGSVLPWLKVLSALALAIVIVKLVDLLGLTSRTDIEIDFGIWVALVAAAGCVVAVARCLRNLEGQDEARL